MDIRYRELSTRSVGVEFEVNNYFTKSRLASFVRSLESKREEPRPVVITRGKKGWAKTVGNQYWHVKYDASCGDIGKPYDHGWEIASYIANATDLEHIANVATVLAAKNVMTNRNCGFHIHVNVSDFTVPMMVSLLCRWLMIEPFLLRLCPEHRHHNNYCKPLWYRYSKYAELMPPFGGSKPAPTVEQFWEAMRPRSLDIHENEYRKQALNLVGYAEHLNQQKYMEIPGDRPTVELRLPECLLSFDHVYFWTGFFLNFVDYCSTDRLYEPKDLMTPDELISSELSHFMKLVGLGHSEKFTIYDNPIAKVRKLFLTKAIDSPYVDLRLKNEASRHLQFIAKI